MTKSKATQSHPDRPGRSTEATGRAILSTPAKTLSLEITTWAGIAVLVGFIFSQWTPHGLRAFLRFDSGIFLYIGEQLHRGAVLYKDVWDHKPPLIFYLNEFGLWAAAGSPIGVLLLDAAAVLLFFLLSFREISRVYGRPAGRFATAAGLLLFLDVTLQPNLGEVVSLPLQAAAFILLMKDVEEGSSIRRAVLQAILFSALLWIRPNGVAISLVYVAHTVFRHRCTVRATSALFAVFAVTAVAACCLFAAPAIAAASWHEVWFATFQFNQLYAGLSTMPERLHALVWMTTLASQHGVFLLAVSGAVLILLSKPRADKWHANARLAVLWLALEMCFAAYSGKLFGKNIIPWILPAMLCIAALIASFGPAANRALNIGTVTGAVFILIFAFSQFRENSRQTDDPDSSLVAFIKTRTGAGARVTFWGPFSTDTILLSDRQPGSRFFNSVPLMHGKPAYRLLAPLELADLSRNRPALIIERADRGFPSLIGSAAEPNITADWDTPELAASKRKLAGLYSLVWRDTRTRTSVYQVAGTSPRDVR